MLLLSLLSRLCRSGALIAMCSLLQAANIQQQLIALHHVRTVEEITRALPVSGLYGLVVKCSPAVPYEERVGIINEALQHDNAVGMVKLDLSGNDLYEPPVLNRLLRLQELDLHENRFLHSPVVLGLAALEEIDLGYNQLVEPPVLTGLTNLRKLSLEHNQLTQAPALTGLVNLEELNLHSNRLTHAPDLTGLVSLYELFLNNNQLVQPPVLTGLTGLEFLFLQDNRLVQPPNLTGLIRLRVLFLANNRLSSPPVLTGLPFLRNLNLSDNNLQQPVIIPQALAGAINLTNIRAPYEIEQPSLSCDTTLVDIATPAVDTVPFFLTQETLTRLPEPKVNPSTRREIVSTMDLVQSWRYWRDHGLAAVGFDEKLQEAEPVLLEDNIYTVSAATARAFLEQRGVPTERIANVLAGHDDAVKVADLLQHGTN